jgi:pyruvate kinase
VSNNKGINLPGVAVSVPALSEKDKDDLRWALRIGVDMVFLSFVRSAEDVEDVHAIMDEVGRRVPVLAKVEKPQAVENLAGIVEAFDGVMVARGDLGVELPLEQVPLVQKQAIQMCREAAKPVIVATQMLESMMAAPAPTRAEASDVAHAVYDGADGVMLSGETAAGRYPVEAVAMMERIIRTVESDRTYRSILEADRVTPETTPSDAITAAARQVAETIGAAAIVTFTSSGSTTIRASRERPSVPILALTPSRVVADNLTVAWGVHPIQVSRFEQFEALIEEAIHRTIADGFAAPGDLLVVTAGLPLNQPGSTNALHIVQVPEPGT